LSEEKTKMVKTSKKKNKKPGLFEEKTKMVKTSKKKNIKTEIKKTRNGRD